MLICNAATCDTTVFYRRQSSCCASKSWHSSWNSCMMLVIVSFPRKGKRGLSAGLLASACSKHSGTGSAFTIWLNVEVVNTQGLG